MRKMTKITEKAGSWLDMKVVRSVRTLFSSPRPRRSEVRLFFVSNESLRRVSETSYLIRCLVRRKSDISIYPKDLLPIQCLAHHPTKRAHYTLSLLGNSGIVKSFSVTISESFSMNEAKSFCAFRKSSSLTVLGLLGHPIYLGEHGHFTSHPFPVIMGFQIR